ncbi:hypothetical protein ABZP36_009824 [Zizania latifolia]
MLAAQKPAKRLGGMEALAIAADLGFPAPPVQQVSSDSIHLAPRRRHRPHVRARLPLATHYVAPRDPTRATNLLAPSADNLLLKEFPRDLMSLKRARLICFYSGCPDTSLKFVEHECRFKQATEFMKLCSPSWTSCSSFMLTHNWWHVAVCYVEGESPTWKVLEVYDHNIIKELEKNDCEAA